MKCFMFGWTCEIEHKACLCEKQDTIEGILWLNDILPEALNTINSWGGKVHEIWMHNINKINEKFYKIIKFKAGRKIF